MCAHSPRYARVCTHLTTCAMIGALSGLCCGQVCDAGQATAALRVSASARGWVRSCQQCFVMAMLFCSYLCKPFAQTACKKAPSLKACRSQLLKSLLQTSSNPKVKF